MATETITRLIDDLDGSPADRTIRFGWEGQTYELELSTQNITAFEKVLQPYLAVARSASFPAQRHASPSKRSTGGSTGPRRDVSTIRSWALTNGYHVSDRGRIPDAVMQAYEAAH